MGDYSNLQVPFRGRDERMRVIVDVTTRGLDETIQNLGAFPDVITMGVAKQMEHWYNTRFRRSVLTIIRTGQPQARIPKNVGRYAQWKLGKYGFDHGLGYLTGRLYNEVRATVFRITETRGKEVRFAVVYDKPFYIAYVHEGTRWNQYRRRPFVEVARDRELPKLVEMIGRMFEDLDFTRPHQELVSSVLATR